jgi:flagellar protein FliO/FliZ
MTSSPQTLWSLLALASLAVAAAFVWLRQRPDAWPRRRPGSMRIVESLPLGPRERLVMVDVGGERLLLGVTAQSVSRVHATSADDAAGPVSASAATGFGEILARERAGEA